MSDEGNALIVPEETTLEAAIRLLRVLSSMEHLAPSEFSMAWAEARELIKSHDSSVILTKRGKRD